MVTQEVHRQRETTERCLAILTECRTRDEIVEGFGRIVELLKQADDPVARAAEMALTNSRDFPDEMVLQLRDEFISKFRAFLSATESLAREIPKPAHESTKRKIKPGWVIAIAAFIVLAGAVCIVAAIGIFLAGQG
jgi:hypothetical protein